MAKVTYVLDSNTLDKEVSVFLEGVTKDQVLSYGKAVKAEVVALIHERAQVQSIGADSLANSVQGELFPQEVGEDTWSLKVWSDAENALWFEEGTGLFGPRGAYITPRNAPFMIFTPYGKSRTVRAIRVEGQKPQHPFRDGLRKVIGRGSSLRRA